MWQCMSQKVISNAAIDNTRSFMSSHHYFQPGFVNFIKSFSFFWQLLCYISTHENSF
uniref:Uncharacterized protein n=1 Tax=Lepeophtheirus salmonis TaxID=72036 RepID=A0A0K2TUA0_LEPSM